MKKRILVIGAAGFIGSNLVRYLLYSKNNYAVIGVDRIDDSRGIHNIYSNKSFDFYIADVLHETIMSRILEISRPNIIINLVDKYEATISLMKVIDNCDFLENIRVVHLSNTNVYKSVENTKEDDEVGSTNLTEAECSVCESIIRNYSQALKVPYNIIRSDFIFGPRQSSSLDVIKRCYHGAKDGRILLSNKGENKRNLTYIEDLNSAVISVIEKGKDNEIYNVSSGSDFTDLEVAFIIKEALKSNAEIDFNFFEDNTYYNINTDKIRELGWKPKLPLRERLQQTVEWFDKNPWYFK